MRVVALALLAAALCAASAAAIGPIVLSNSNRISKSGTTAAPDAPTAAPKEVPSTPLTRGPSESSAPAAAALSTPAEESQSETIQSVASLSAREEMLASETQELPSTELPPSTEPHYLAPNSGCCQPIKGGTRCGERHCPHEKATCCRFYPGFCCPHGLVCKGLHPNGPGTRPQVVCRKPCEKDYSVERLTSTLGNLMKNAPAALRSGSAGSGSAGSEDDGHSCP